MDLVDLLLKDVDGRCALNERRVHQQVNDDVTAENDSREGVKPSQEEVVASANRGGGKVCGCRRGQVRGPFDLCVRIIGCGGVAMQKPLSWAIRNFVHRRRNRAKMGDYALRGDLIEGPGRRNIERADGRSP